ncbi:MAG TPA: response regulator [Sphingomonas sp.]|nr:response regulator [Sphingomonas sp.]
MQPETGAPRRRHVLLTEDDYWLAKELAESLAASGVDVIGPVASVEAAITRIEREALDGAILDATLLDGDIGPVADLLDRRGVPFVLLTSRGDGEIPPRFRNRPRRDKPAPAAELLGMLFGGD